MDYAMAEAQPAIFLEQAHYSLLQAGGLAEAKEAYEMARDLDPVAALQHAANIVAQPWAEKYLIEAAKAAPHAAFSFFDKYGFIDGRDARSYKMNSNTQVIETVIRSETKTMADKLNVPLSDYENSIQRNFERQREIQTQQPELRSYARAVLLAATEADPKAARTYERIWKDLPFAAEIEAIVKATPQTGQNGGVQKTKSFTRFTSDDSQGIQALLKNRATSNGPANGILSRP